MGRCLARALDSQIHHQPVQCVQLVQRGATGVAVGWKAGSGKIVNVSSGTVFKGTPNMLHYVTSKGAVVAFTRSLARELGDDGICVNAIAPGLTMSEAVAASPAFAPNKAANLAGRAIKRDEMPDDLVGAVLFLCSSDSDFVTGQTLVVDGGSAMH